MGPFGETARISFPFRRVAAAFAIRLISGGHEHDKLDPMTAFTLRAANSPAWSLLSTTTALGPSCPPELAAAHTKPQI